MRPKETVLDRLLREAQQQTAEARAVRTTAELERMIRDAPPVRSFHDALRGEFGLIAEIKKRSPSKGDMLSGNVEDAPLAYQQSAIVKAVSVLTARSFGMGLQDLRRIRSLGHKPILRKDFIQDEYQVYEARAFGADAILLMANVLDEADLKRLSQLAFDLDMDVLFECHTREQIGAVPSTARIYGINTRKFESRRSVLGITRYGISRFWRRFGKRDWSVQYVRLELVKHLPEDVLKVAESGVGAGQIGAIRDDLGYHAALVGTALLTHPGGVSVALNEFENALASASLGVKEPILRHQHS
jgi:indole-3-glycerol phosphate synthase